MIIVNQTRDSIINFDNAQGIELVGQNIFVEFDYAEDKCQKIGYYKTEERAKEVFAQISLALIRKTKVFEMPEFS